MTKVCKKTILEIKKEIREESKEVGNIIMKILEDPKIEIESKKLHKKLTSISDEDLNRKFTI